MKMRMGDDGNPVFFCPGCKCGHKVWVAHPNEVTGATWSWNSSMDKPTFQPSILITHPIWHPPVTQENQDEWRKNPWPQTQVTHTCHSYVTDGHIQFLADCTHHLKDQTVELPDFDTME